ncbi:hypothetical protein HK096_002079 [Nowakowskiella sp. JEL0078]|nr:hypothetical protein HK096_002079 [Nowakowskiella sp. JEL0078]
MGTDTSERKNFSKLNVSELIKICRELGLESPGVRKALLSRIQAYYSNNSEISVITSFPSVEKDAVQELRNECKELGLDFSGSENNIRLRLEEYYLTHQPHPLIPKKSPIKVNEGADHQYLQNEVKTQIDGFTTLMQTDHSQRASKSEEESKSQLESASLNSEFTKQNSSGSIDEMSKLSKEYNMGSMFEETALIDYMPPNEDQSRYSRESQFSADTSTESYKGKIHMDDNEDDLISAAKSLTGPTWLWQEAKNVVKTGASLLGISNIKSTSKICFSLREALKKRENHFQDFFIPIWSIFRNYDISNNSKQNPEFENEIVQLVNEITNDIEQHGTSKTSVWIAFILMWLKLKQYFGMSSQNSKLKEAFITFESTLFSVPPLNLCEIHNYLAEYSFSVDNFNMVVSELLKVFLESKLNLDVEHAKKFQKSPPSEGDYWVSMLQTHAILLILYQLIRGCKQTSLLSVFESRIRLFQIDKNNKLNSNGYMIFTLKKIFILNVFDFSAPDFNDIGSELLSYLLKDVVVHDEISRFLKSTASKEDISHSVEQYIRAVFELVSVFMFVNNSDKIEGGHNFFKFFFSGFGRNMLSRVDGIRIFVMNLTIFCEKYFCETACNRIILNLLQNEEKAINLCKAFSELRSIDTPISRTTIKRIQVVAQASEVKSIKIYSTLQLQIPSEDLKQTFQVLFKYNELKEFAEFSESNSDFLIEQGNTHLPFSLVLESNIEIDKLFEFVMLTPKCSQALCDLSEYEIDDFIKKIPEKNWININVNLLLLKFHTLEENEKYSEFYYLLQLAFSRALITKKSPLASNTFVTVSKIARIDNATRWLWEMTHDNVRNWCIPAYGLMVQIAKEWNKSLPDCFSDRLKIPESLSTLFKFRKHMPVKERYFPVISLVDKEFDKIRDIFITYAAPEVGAWKEYQLRWYHVHMELLKALEAKLLLETVDLAYEKLVTLRQELSNMLSLLQWIAGNENWSHLSQNCLNEIQNLIVDPTINQLEFCLDTAKSSLGLDFESLGDALFFISKKSILFNVICKKFAMKLEFEDKIFGVDDLQTVIKLTTVFFKELENGFEFDKFRLLYEASDGLSSLDTEFSLISERWHLQKINPKQIEDMSRDMKNTAEFFHFIQNRDSLYSFFNQFDIFPEITQALQSACDSQLDLKSIKPSEIKQILENISEILGENFKSYHYELFATMAKDGALFVDFVRSRKDFQKRVQFLTGTIQGYEVGTVLLHNVVAAEKLAAKILTANSTDTTFDARRRFHSMMNDISTIVFSKEDFKREIARLRTVSLHLPEIKVLFSMGNGLRLDNVVSYMGDLVASGKYRSLLTSNGGKLLFIYRDGRTDEDVDYPSALLDDLVLQIRVFIQNTVSVQTKEIGHFLTMYKNAHEIHSIRIQLQAEGHPEYIKGWSGLQRQFSKDTDSDVSNDKSLMEISVSQDIESVLHIHEKLKQELGNWMKVCHCHGVGRLSLLTHKQYASLLNIINFGTVCVNKVDEVSHHQQLDFYRELLPYLVLMFPDCKVKQFNQIDSLPMVGEFENDQDGRSWEEVAKIADVFVKSLEDQFLIEVRNQSHKVSSVKVDIINAVNLDPTQLFYAIFELNGFTPPKPSFLFWCNNQTTSSNIIKFVERANHYNKEKTIVVGVNRLSMDTRQELCTYVLAKTELTQSFDLTLIFMDTMGISMYSFLPPPIQVDIRKDIQLKDLGMVSAIDIQTLELVYGSTCSGKTFYIKQQTAALEQAAEKAALSVSFTINEDWDVTSFMLELSHLKVSGTTVIITFFVSSYANLEKFEYFLYLLIFFGLTIHEESGTVQCYSLITSKWYIFVELSPAPESEIGMPHNNRDLLVTLPTLCAFRTNFQPWTIQPYVVDFATRLVAGILNGFYKKLHRDIDNSQGTKTNDVVQTSQGILQLADNTTVNSMPDIEVRSVLDICRAQIKLHYGFELPTNHITTQSFVQILKLKFDWLVQFCKYCVRTSIERIYEPPSLLLNTWISIFVAEAAKMSSYRVAIPQMEDSTIFSICSDPSVSLPTISFLNFSRKTDNILRLHNAPPIFHYTDRKIALDSPGRLRIEISASIGQHRSSNLVTVIEKSKFILTPSIGINLLFLHSRRISGLNLIYTGETGTGKTEMLEFYSNLLRGEFPDMFALIYEFIQETLLRYNIAFQTQIQIELRNCLNVENLNHRCERINNVFKQLCLTAMMDEDPEVKKDKSLERVENLLQQADEEVHTPSLDAVRKSFIQWLHEILNKYNLIDITHEKMLSVKNLLVNFDDINLEELLQLIELFLKAGSRKVFYTLPMHAGLSALDIKQRVLEVAAVAEELKFTGSTVILFMDEFNTTSVMGVVKEIICDRTIDAKDLPKNLFIVAAMNPYTYSMSNEASMHTGTKPEPGILDSTGKKIRDYIVHNPQDSLIWRSAEFGEFTEIQEIDFVSLALGSEVSNLDATDDQKILFADLILLGQRAIRNANISRVKASIRDVMRALKLLQFFGSKIGRKLALAFQNSKLAFSYAKNSRAFAEIAVLSLAVSHLYRLRPGSERIDFLKKIDDKINRKFNWNLNIFNAKEKIENAMLTLFKKAVIPKAVAPTSAFLENFFVLAVCMEANIPLLITGPAGSSKTLSGSILGENMVGSRSNAFFVDFHHLHTFRYQCSASSSDKQVQSIYQTALDRQRILGVKNRCSVILDEAGLPKEMEMPLKVLHYLTDKPEVATLILSNTILDAAKTNRCAFLQHGKTPPEDLFALVKGTVFNDVDAKGGKELIGAFCKCFEKLADFTKPVKENLFQQRDIIFFLRALRKRQMWADSKLHISPDALLGALRRNFNGVGEEAFQGIVNMFFRNLSKVDQRIPDADSNFLTKMNDNIITPLLESFKDFDNDSDPNTSPFRYIMLLDPTLNNTAVSLFQKLISGIRDSQKLRIVTVGDFPADVNDLEHSSVVIDVKEAMSRGDTVLLVNSGPVRTNFYDAFNRYFTVYIGEHGREEQFVNVAVGSLSKPVFVHERFKMIIVVPLRSIAEIPLPFLDRFEKYQLSVRHIQKQLKKEIQIPRDLAINIDKLSDFCSDFVNCVHTGISNNRLLFGFDCKDSLQSYLFTILEASAKNSSLTVPGFDSIGESFSNVDLGLQLFRRANLQILQLARPEEIILLKGRMPTSYLSCYLLHQEHFSMMRLIYNRIYGFISLGQFDSVKLCIFTRTCDDTSKGYLLLNNILELYLIIYKPAGIAKVVEISGGIGQVINLSDIQSTSECSAIISSFFAQPKSNGIHVLVCLCNVEHATSNQLNFLRTEIDSHITDNQIAIMVIHHPPESSFLSEKYQAIFLNSWEYVYVDGFGTNADVMNGIPLLDIRRLIAAGLGIGVPTNDSEQLSKSFGKIFESYFNNVLQDFVKGLQIQYLDTHMNRIMSELPRTSSIYCLKGKDRYSALLKFLDKDDQFIKFVIMKRFTDAWSRKLLRSVIEYAGAKIREGSDRSMTQVLQESMFELFSVFVRSCLVLLLSSGSLERIDAGLDTKTSTEVQLYQSLVTAALDSIVVQDHVELFSSERQMRFSVTIKNSVPSLAFFDIIENHILSTSRSVKSKNSLADVMLESIVKKLVSSGPFQKLISIIDSNPELIRTAKKDFILRTLNIKISNIDIFVQTVNELIDKLLWSKSSLVELIMMRHINGELLANLKVAFSNLNEISVFAAPKFEVFEVTKPLSVLQSVFAEIVVLLYNRFQTLISPDQLRSWVLATRTLAARLRRPMWLDKSVLKKYDFLVSVHIIVSNARIPLQAAYELIKQIPINVSLNETLQFIENKRKETHITSDSTTRIFEELMSFFLLPLYDSNLQSMHDFELVQPPFEIFLDSCEHIEDPLSSSMFAPFLWCVRMLRRILQSSVPDVFEWSKNIINKRTQETDVLPQSLLLFIPSEIKENFAMHGFQSLPSLHRLSVVVLCIFMEQYMQADLHTLCTLYRTTIPPRYAQITFVNKVDRTALQLIILRKSGKSLIGLSSQSPEDTLFAIRHILNTQLNELSTAACRLNFLSSLPKTSIVELLKTPSLLEIFPVGDWLNKNNLENTESSQLADFSLPSFTIDKDGSANDTAKEGYFELRAVIASGNINLLHQYVHGMHVENKLADRLKCRMQLIIICYFDYFQRNKCCALVNESLSLANSLLIRELCMTANELPAFRFIANGPIPRNSPRGSDVTMALFLENEKSEIRDLMVIILAVVVGSPPKSTHLYGL